MSEPIDELASLRRFYAEELRAVANLQSERVVQAFAKVPRERFLGPGPWRVFGPGAETDWMTQDADPARLYHNLLVVIDAKRQLNNGCPSFLAFLIDGLELQPGEHVVHVGCGPGYYTAVMAEVVGNQGRVTAIEIDAQLAHQARENLSYLSHIKVIEGNGNETNPGPCDALLINAGATHPRSIWLDSLRPGGRMLLPLTTTDDADTGGAGRILKITRQANGLSASFISGVKIFPCVGGRDAELNQRLNEAFKRDEAVDTIASPRPA